MKDAEETIERLLAGLRDAEPAAGIERRILEALDGMDAREASASASLWGRPLRPAMAMLLACTVMLMVAITVHRAPHAPANLSHAKSSDMPQAIAPEVVAQKAPTVPRRLVSRVAARRAYDGPTVGENQTASFPAPPSPLTEQERLLLRLAHRGDAENMALLNPAVQAAQIAKATVQFQQFFAIDATEMRSQSE
jgi:hypothetical protein